MGTAGSLNCLATPLIVPWFTVKWNQESVIKLLPNADSWHNVAYKASRLECLIFRLQRPATINASVANPRHARFRSQNFFCLQMTIEKHPTPLFHCREPRERTGRSFPVGRIGPEPWFGDRTYRRDPSSVTRLPSNTVGTSSSHLLSRCRESTSRVKKPGPALPGVPFSPNELYACPRREASCFRGAVAR